VGCALCYLRVALLLFVLSLFSCLCVCFLSISLFLVICAFVLVQTLLGRIKIVSVTAFLLMKNLLRQGREKGKLLRIISNF